MSVLLLVFILQLLIHLINTVGSQAVNDVLWWLYTQLPTPHSADAAALTKLRRDVVRLQRELNATSAQDDFATWARLRRQHDKAKDQYEKKCTSSFAPGALLLAIADQTTSRGI